MKSGFNDKNIKSDLNMREVILTKISSTHENLRSDTVQGFGDAYVEIGEPFIMFSNNSFDGDSNKFRYVKTSPVVKVNWLELNKMEFETENSTYQLEYLGA